MNVHDKGSELARALKESDEYKALRRARQQEERGFTYSYDMLGEAATTAADAARYLADYERAIRAIGKASGGRGIYAGPGISIIQVSAN